VVSDPAGGVTLLLAATGVLAAVLTALLLRYTRSRGLLDQPSERSSHLVPTPRGGGAAIVVAVLVGTVAGLLSGRVAQGLAYALLLGGPLVAAIGWLDDWRGVAAGRRLLVHAVSAGVAVAALGGLQGAGRMGVFLACLGIVWAINLYNFMDGLDGLAASEAVTVGASSAALLSISGRPDLAIAAAFVAVAAAGFLPWNWPPARIFLGDVGSGFLGYVFGVLALATHNAMVLPVHFWLVLLGVFVFDATVTLFRRMLGRERITRPHRVHAYQRLARAGWSHRQVTVSVIGVNLLLSLWVWLARTRGLAVGWFALASFGALLALYLAVERVAPFAEYRTSEGSSRYK
jgi:Fuc2NAc and GlcNAc transferase